MNDIPQETKGRDNPPQSTEHHSDEMPDNLRVIIADDVKIMRMMLIKQFQRINPSWNVDVSGIDSLYLSFETLLSNICSYKHRV